MLRYVSCRCFTSSSIVGKGPIIPAGKGKPRTPFNQFNQVDSPLSAEDVASQKAQTEAHNKHLGILPEGQNSRGPFRSTLQLPSTKFELKKPGQNDELLYRDMTTSELYKWQSEQDDRPTFVLHDGPPYANGKTHLGHSVNKVLKDVINRYQLLQGNRVHYIPGWDCHGLPIEQKVTGKFPGVSPTNIAATDLRPAARQYALKTAASQKDEFKLLGIMADWSKATTYRTLDTSYEMNQLKIFKEMVNRDLITRAIKPVYWSPSSQTALAEAEVVHNPDHQSRSLYVRYDLRPGPSLKEAVKGVPEAARILEEGLKGKISAMIWTTTPWSLTANMALTVNPELLYSLVIPKEGPCKDEIFLVASDRVPAFEKIKVGLSTTDSKKRPLVGTVDELAQFPGSALLDSTYRHPFLPRAADNRPILGAAYVTSDAGTGLVHCAPAHGIDDYNTWQEYCHRNPAAREIEVINAVDYTGTFTRQIEDLMSQDLDLNIEQERRHTLTNQKVLSNGGIQVTSMLHRDGWALSELPIQHTYPYDWRTNLPLVIRSTPQWFVKVDKIKQKAIKALEKVRFVPESARAKLESLVLSRNEWCISRQRVWGVPIPVLYNRETGEPLLSSVNVEHIIQILTKNGSDYWWMGNAEEFVAPQERRRGVEWVKGTDTMDVWFDSGSSWTILPGAQQQTGGTSTSFTSSATSPADMYIEGTDQHRGWFQSSLLTHVAVSSSQDEPVAPYKTLISHAFTVDRKGDKMSKSKLNVISPEFFLLGGPKNKQPAFGADPLRWWVARIDFTSDIIVSALVIRHASDELRKVRNTFRFLLSYVPLPHEVPVLEDFDLDFTEQYMMHTLHDLNVACKQAYDNYDFAQVTRRVVEYANTLVSSFYIVNIKDMLYADGKEDQKRQAAIAVLNHIFLTLLSAVGPFAPHLAEEVWHYYNGAQAKPQAVVPIQPKSTQNKSKVYDFIQDETSESEKADAIPQDGAQGEFKSFFQNAWHVVPKLDRGAQVKEDMMVILRLRTSIQIKLEQLRQFKSIKSSLGVRLKMVLPKHSKVADIIRRRRDDLARIFQMAHCEVVDELPQNSDGNFPCLGSCEDTEVDFAILLSEDEECPRCRQFIRKQDEDVCSRCDQVMTDLYGGHYWDKTGPYSSRIAENSSEDLDDSDSGVEIEDSQKSS